MEPLPFKLLMIPHNWFKIARAYLTKDEFLLWMDIYKNLAQKKKELFSSKTSLEDDSWLQMSVFLQCPLHSNNLLKCLTELKNLSSMTTSLL